MKIGLDNNTRTKGLNSNISTDSSELDRSLKTGKGVSFSQTLTQNIKISDYKEGIEKLLSEIDRWAGKLIKRPVPENIYGYRDKVKAFLKSVVENGLDVTSVQSRPGDKQKMLLKVKKVDQKLLSKTDQMLGDQKENLDILQFTDDIRGLLLDLVI